jgi:GntR family transcriptional regulator
MDAIHLNNTHIPLHYQIADYILELLAKGNLSPEEQLPTEEELREIFGVSRTTIRRALDHLRSKDLLVRRQGIGTFWSESARTIKQEKLSGINRQIFHIKKETKVQVLSKSTQKASDEIADFLRLSPQSDVIVFERLRSDQDELVSYTINYLPLSYGSKIDKEHLIKMTMLETLEKIAMINLGAIEHQVEITRADQIISKHLQIPVLDPVLTINTRVFDTYGTPVEIVWTHFVEHKYKFRVILDK